MKLQAIKLRAMVAPPQHVLTSQSTLNDVFAGPEYAIETRGDAWLRITHVQTGKSRLYPREWCMGADEAPPEQQPGQGQKQGGKRG